jgi:hypothetical protein
MKKIPVDREMNFKSFNKYKNKYNKNTTAFLLGTGDTLKLLTPSDTSKSSNKIVVGVNYVPYTQPDLHLDYYFFGHRTKIYKPYKTQPPKNGQIRFGLTMNTDYTAPGLIKALSPISEINELKGNPFINSWSHSLEKDIDIYPTKAGSIIFSAFQFLAYSGVTDNVLIGCDCDNQRQKIISRWIDMKKAYPEIRIRVLRPKGLKDVFEEYIT